MVQTSSIAFFATVAICASPALGAAVPSKSDPAAATTTTSTRPPTNTPSPATFNTPGSRIKEEQQLITELYNLEDGSSSVGRPATGNKKVNLAQNLKKDGKATSTRSGNSTTETGKPDSFKAGSKDRRPEDERLRKERLREGRLGEDRERLQHTKSDADRAQDRLRLNRERLQRPSGSSATSSSTSLRGTSTVTPPTKLVNNKLAKVSKPSSSSVSSTATSSQIKPTSQPQSNAYQQQWQQEKLWVQDLDQLFSKPPPVPRGYEDSQNDIRSLEEEGGLWVRGYDNSQNNIRSSDGHWARGYDNSQNDVRDFDEDMEYSAMDDDPESFERDVDSILEELYQRYDFEGLEDLE